MRNDDYTDVRNTLAVALALWAGAVAAGTRSEVFARLPAPVLLALAIFATAFAIAAVAWDVRLRQWLDGLGARTARLALLSAAAVAVTAVVGLAGARTPSPGDVPWAALLLLGVPLASALAVAALGAAWRRAGGSLRRPASPAPARHPAAT